MSLIPVVLIFLFFFFHPFPGVAQDDPPCKFCKVTPSVFDLPAGVSGTDVSAVIIASDGSGVKPGFHVKLSRMKFLPGDDDVLCDFLAWSLPGRTDLL